MRILPERNDHGGGGVAQRKTKADRCRHRCRNYEYLPLRYIPAYPRGDPRRGRRLRLMEVVMTFIPKIDRRSLLASAAAIGGAFVLGFELPIRSDTAHAANGAPEINAWIVIHPDDSITLRYPRAEMGQGSYTALPMLLAEELECDWSKGKVETVEPAVNLRRNRIYGDMFSTGSRTIRGSQDYVRKAGAAAREMLIAAAAQAWNVPARECRAENSRITHGPSERTVNFAKVAVSAAKLDPPKDVKLKDPKEWKLAGKPTRRLEISDKVQGKPIYGIDVRLPNMLYASLIQCPVFKGTLKSVDDSKLSGLRGVRGRKASECGRRRCRLMVAGENGRRGSTGHLERRGQRSSIQPVHRGVRTHRPDFIRRWGRPPARQCGRRPNRRGQAEQCRVLCPIPESRDDGAAELHGPRHRRQGGDLGSDPGSRALPECGCAGARYPAGQYHPPSHDGRRRLRPAWRAARLRHLPSARGQGPRSAGESSLEPRRGHAARLLPACHDGKDDGGSGCIGHAHCVACAPGRPIDPGAVPTRRDQRRRGQAYAGGLPRRDAL